MALAPIGHEHSPTATGGTDARTHAAVHVARARLGDR